MANVIHIWMGAFASVFAHRSLFALFNDGVC